MYSIIRNTTVAAALALAGLASVPAHSADRPNLKTYWNIQRHFGVVPKFFNLFPEDKLPGLWSEYNAVQLNPNTALDAKTKQLIGLAVAAQAGCSACIYFQTSAALANGANYKEIQEAVAIFVIEDNWSKILTDTTFEMVKQDTDTLVSIGTLKETPPAPVPMY
jgi:AhpD family alkylhydroperoxidase